MNLPALIFINEIDDYMGTHIIRHINVHHRHMRKSEDFLMFPYVENQANLSMIISNTLIVLWLIIGSLLAMLNNVKCNQFNDWYDKKYVQKKFFSENLPGFWLFIDYLQVLLFLPTSAVTYFPLLGVYFLKKCLRDKILGPNFESNLDESSFEKFALKTTKKGVKSQTNKKRQIRNNQPHHLELKDTPMGS